MKPTLATYLASLLFISYPLTGMSDVLVEYSFADSDASTATNTGTLGAAVDGVISGGTIIASPLSSDGLGLLLDGMNGSGISMPNAFDYDEELTVAALVRLDALNGQNLNIIFDDFGSPGVLLSVNADGFLRFTVSTANGDATVVGDSAFPLTTWHQVAGVYDGSSVLLYVDSELVASTAATGVVISNPDVTPNVGVESAGTVFPWSGAIDDFRIYDEAISIDQCLLGDVNLDGSITLLDVNPFVNVLVTGDFQCEADINQDGAVTLLDVDPFVALLAGE